MGEHHDYQEFEDLLHGPPNGEVVHWMEPRRLVFGPAAISVAVAGAFALGLAAAIVAFGISRIAGPERRMSLPLDRRLRRLN